MLSLFLSGEWFAGDAERERDLSFLSSERERSLNIYMLFFILRRNNYETHRDRDLPFDFSEALLALLFLSRLEALLPLRLESRSRLRDLDFSE